MPDGDIVHAGLRSLYQKPYTWLCEGKADDEECARVALKALKKDLCNKGDLAIPLVQKMAHKLNEFLQAHGTLRVANLAILGAEFEALTQSTFGRNDIKEIINTAGKELLHDIRYGKPVDYHLPAFEIMKRFLSNIYVSEFKDKIPLTQNHHAGISDAELHMRVKSIEPHIASAFENWAKKAIEKNSFKKLMLPRRKSIKAIDMEENLL